MDKVAMGKKARRDGMAFECKVRNDLESKGWIVDKWTNNVNLMCSHKRSCCGKLHPAKSFRGITRSNGFPDFIAFRRIKVMYLDDKIHFLEYNPDHLNEVIAVESKMNGVLSKVEKEKCRWYLDNSIFSKIKIAMKCSKELNNGIVYKDYVRGLKK